MFERADRDFAALNAAHAAFLRGVATVHEDRSWEREGATSTTAWLRGRYGVTKATALEWVRVARALRSLPAISEAFSEGLLSFEQLRPVTKFATTETDEGLAHSAQTMSAPGLWDEARRHERILEQDVEDIHRNRYLALWWNEERTELSIQSRLGAEQGAAVERAFLEGSEQIALADEPHDRGGARMADALVQLVTAPAGEGASPVLVVHADAEVLSSESGESAETEDGVRLTTAAVRRLACDARIEWILEREGRAVGWAGGDARCRERCSGLSGSGTGAACSRAAGGSGG
jgi:hypothetical protein